MKIAVFSTGGQGEDSLYAPRITYFPRRAAAWEEAVRMYPDASVTLYLTPTAEFLWEETADSAADETKVRCVWLPLGSSIAEIADTIAEDQPDIAIACSVAEIPYDWNPLRDTLVAEQLRFRGIETIAHPRMAVADTFRKDRTHDLLAAHGFSVAKQVYVPGVLFFAARDPAVTENRYREFIYEEIKALNFPVVIKPSASAGSVGITVAWDMTEVRDALEANGGGEAGTGIPADFLVEERINGRNFGIEIYGTPGHYTVTPPVMFSETKKGVTDPFASVKYGPVTDSGFLLEELEKEMLRLAEVLSLSGAAEIDLMFTGKEWYIIEVNPRYSMLSLMPAAMRAESAFAPYLYLTAGKGVYGEGERVDFPRVVLDFKSPMLPRERMQALYESYDFIDQVMEFCMVTSDSDSVGYCEYVVSGETPEELKKRMKALRDKEPDTVSDAVYENMLALMEA